MEVLALSITFRKRSQTEQGRIFCYNTFMKAKEYGKLPTEVMRATGPPLVLGAIDNIVTEVGSDEYAKIIDEENKKHGNN